MAKVELRELGARSSTASESEREKENGQYISGEVHIRALPVGLPKRSRELSTKCAVEPATVVKTVSSGCVGAGTMVGALVVGRNVGCSVTSAVGDSVVGFCVITGLSVAAKGAVGCIVMPMMVGNAVGSMLGGRDSVGATVVGNAVGAYVVGKGVGLTVGVAVVGAAVGGSVGARVVGRAVGDVVGMRVGLSEGTAVGTSVGMRVGGVGCVGAGVVHWNGVLGEKVGAWAMGALVEKIPPLSSTPVVPTRRHARHSLPEN
jgi:hypothetical protein